MTERNLSHSQNFFRSPETVRGLLDLTSINKTDLVVEIGPGKGMITRELADRASKVVAIELDPHLAQRTEAKLGALQNVSFVRGDFLKWNLPDRPYKVFSNIPFDLTADIVRRLTQKDYSPEVAYLIIQDKALQRFAGYPLDVETQASLLIKPWFDVGVVSRIGRKAFIPVPHVDIVLGHFTKRKQPIVNESLWHQYRDFIIYGFNQWKPTTAEAFREVFSSRQLSIIRRQANIDLKPTAISFEDWLALFDAFTGYVPEGKKRIVFGSEMRLKSQQSKLKKVHRTR